MDSLYKKILARLIINGGEVFVDIAEIMTNLIDASTLEEYEDVKVNLLKLLENKLGISLYKVEVKTRKEK
jgi:hypothetical protein